MSQTPDYVMPATSHVLQHRLGLPSSTLCIDINEGCSGFITGLYTAGLLAANTGGSVLLLGGDTISKLTSPGDRGSRLIFGDAGYSAVISPESGGRIDFMFESYGDRSGALIMENSRHRIVESPKNDGMLFMDGAAIMSFTLSDVFRAVNAFLEGAGLTVGDVTLFAFHQANRLMLRTLAKKLGVPDEKLPFTAGSVGNTSSASIPLLLSGMSGSADMSRVLLAGFGVGLSIGVCAVDFTRTKFFRTIYI